MIKQTIKYHSTKIPQGYGLFPVPKRLQKDQVLDFLIEHIKDGHLVDWSLRQEEIELENEFYYYCESYSDQELLQKEYNQNELNEQQSEWTWMPFKICSMGRVDKIPYVERTYYLDFWVESAPLERVPNWRIWLAYLLNEINDSPHCHSSGRDLLRSVRARFDQMGIEQNAWQGIEQAVLQNQTAIGISANTAKHRIMNYLAGPRPIGPIERCH